jgi:hypothetical protein
MKTEDILNKIQSIRDEKFPFEDFDNKLQVYKLQLVKEDRQDEAKQIWIFQTIISIHKGYVKAINLMRSKEYYPAWCQLEKVEKILPRLKKHFNYSDNEFHLQFVERSIRTLQVIYPYRLFGSAEILKKKKKCSVCDAEISIRNFCGHEVGEIYDGEMCYREVTEAEILGLALVENPGNKYSVMFITNEETGEQTDHYNYEPIDYLMNHMKSAYEFWDIEISKREIKRENFGNIELTDLCTCGSDMIFEKCCQKKIGQRYTHFVFLLEEPSEDTLYTSTTKK